MVDKLSRGTQKMCLKVKKNIQNKEIYTHKTYYLKSVYIIKWLIFNGDIKIFIPPYNNLNLE